MSHIVTVACVPAAVLLTYGSHFGKIYLMSGTYDNTRPRDLDTAMKDETPEKRALITRLGNAHTNQLETLGLFSSGVAAAIATNASVVRSMAAALTYVIGRAAFIAIYAAPQFANGSPRTIAFGVSMLSIFWLWAESIAGVASV